MDYNDSGAKSLEDYYLFEGLLLPLGELIY